MPKVTINKERNSGTYFLTCTVLNWSHVLNRYKRCDILALSLKHFMKEKHLKLHAFVFMSNHIHLIIESDDVISFIRDFKKYTAKRMKESFQKYEPRILTIFKNKNGMYQFWQHTNMPVILETERFYLQKKKYIENNPVTKEYVDTPESWYWSSANETCTLQVNVDYQKELL